jgi:hypothetical protein
MALQRVVASVAQQGSLAGLPLLCPLLLRTMASGPTKEAVERTLVVDTLAQVWKTTALQLRGASVDCAAHVVHATVPTLWMCCQNQWC